MRQPELNVQLQELFLNDYSDEFIAFCHRVVPKYPVAINLSEQVNRCYDMLGNAMIVFSGYRSEEFDEFAKAAQIMVHQEVDTGRWDGLSGNEEDAAELIARRSYDALMESCGVVDDPDRLYMVLGLYTYSVVVCNDCFDGNSFMRLFIQAWFFYFSTLLSFEKNGSMNTPGIKS